MIHLLPAQVPALKFYCSFLIDLIFFISLTFLSHPKQSQYHQAMIEAWGREWVVFLHLVVQPLAVLETAQVAPHELDWRRRRAHHLGLDHFVRITLHELLRLLPLRLADGLVSVAGLEARVVVLLVLLLVVVVLLLLKATSATA